nr:hypothetical protein [Pseudomonas sp. ALS1131]
MTDYNRNIVQALAATGARILIRGATILSMDADIGNLVRGDILIEGSMIKAVGENIEAGDAAVIDATGMIAMPGMVDTHRHSWEGQLRRINPNAATLEDYCNALLVRQVLSPG